MKSEQLPTGTVLVYPDADKPIAVGLYARVSGNEFMADLDRQLARLSAYAAERQWLVVEVVKEVGFGFDGHCRHILKLLKNEEVHVILVESRDRVSRFGHEYIDAILAAQGRQVLAIDEAARPVDFMAEMRQMALSICENIYGKACTSEQSAMIMAELMGGKEEGCLKAPS